MDGERERSGGGIVPVRIATAEGVGEEDNVFKSLLRVQEFPLVCGCISLWIMCALLLE